MFGTFEEALLLTDRGVAEGTSGVGFVEYGFMAGEFVERDLTSRESKEERQEDIEVTVSACGPIII